MKSLIPLSFYSNAEVFEAEKCHLQNLWSFVCLTIDLENHNDFLTKEIGGHSVVIQNFHGELKAFENVCSHRFSRIRQCSHGNGLLKCPYHGWVYDTEGVPCGIPNYQNFEGFSEEIRQSLRLQSWQLETCGKFIFIRYSKDHYPLKDYLAEIYNLLIDYSEAMNKRIDEYQMSIQANWKIVVENTLDNYHLPAVHANSFGKFGSVEGQYCFFQPHSTYLARPKSHSSKKKANPNSAVQSILKVDGYQHNLIFPSLLLSTFSGLSMSIHAISPISPSETIVHVHTFTGKLQHPQLDEVFREMYGEPTAQLVQSVWKEDQPICEQVHLGLINSQGRESMYCKDECRIYDFQTSYLKLFNSHGDIGR
ncbi:aromatic ring-hydroxylating oxygenase subunit alpha [Neosynechococcus sphagnicola]|uniref:aromatic ring-hydroxylating oxygenase subunit alpha n=1 Tax=Neosynechococcus sphagnicola TaxID=1501145 RepID=UPI000907776F|nr:aromatic ring-hydroxylating dioxygenase subunit alpha [Neosynechococcus sphagnicola]